MDQSITWSSLGFATVKSHNFRRKQQMQYLLQKQISIRRLALNCDLSTSTSYEAATDPLPGSMEASSSGSSVNIPYIETLFKTLPVDSKRKKLLHICTQILRAVKHWGADCGFELRGKEDKPDLPILLSAVTTTVLPAGGWSDLGHNYIFQAGFWGWLIAQCLKIFTKRYKQGIWDVRAVVDSGGMPSSHSSLTAAVTTAVALEFGLGSSLFAIALCFTVITMYDAAGVRRHAGKQAEVLNILLDDVLQGHPISDRKLKEVLGHTPIQVLSGALLGIIVACFVPSPSQLPAV